MKILYLYSCVVIGPRASSVLFLHIHQRFIILITCMHVQAIEYGIVISRSYNNMYVIHTCGAAGGNNIGIKLYVGVYWGNTLVTLFL